MTIDHPHTIAVWAEGTSALDLEPIMGDKSSPSGMPWPADRADLRHFRETTRGHVLIMGYTTFTHLPAELKLPGSLAERPIIVLTRSHLAKVTEETVYTDAIRATYPGNTTEAGVVIHNLQHLPEYEGKPIAVIGGPQVIELFEPFYDELVVTHFVGRRYKGDVRAPSDSFMDNFNPTARKLLDSGARVTNFERRIPKEN
ncbi:dihydrofolate reductase [Microbacterium phage Vitas]|uniref:Dihydrofolate reductase n=1 Tax=Microbacterium phage Vitas TaxID=2603259 RepID=A0A5B8WHK6_9CAUD|nr:dihydrofolate reductase [Microbacterium phage Vitas]